MNRQKMQPTKLRIIVKFCTLLLGLYLLITFMFFTVQYATGSYDVILTKAEQMDCYERLYKENNYSELRDALLLYDAYDEEFDLYWEAVNGYGDYMQYLQWEKSMNAKIEGSEEMVARYEDIVNNNFLHCEFEKNKSQLEAYVNRIKKN